MRRRTEYNELLSKELQDVDFAREYLLGMTEDDEISYEQALRHMIGVMGAKEFCKLTKLPKPRVAEFVNGKKLKPDTLDQFLKPFRLRTRIIFEEIPKRKRKTASS